MHKSLVEEVIMKQTFVYVDIFDQKWKQLGLAAAEQRELELQLLMDSRQGAVIYAGGNLSTARTKTVAVKEITTFSTQNIKNLRLQMNLTQKSFAALIGSLSKRSNRGSTAPTERCSPTPVGNFEQSVSRSRRTTYRFCITISYLINSLETDCQV